MTAVPAGPIGWARKLNLAPARPWYADFDGSGCHGSRQLRVISACSMRRSHWLRGNFEDAVAKVAIKWFFQLRMTRSARLAR